MNLKLSKDHKKSNTFYLANALKCYLIKKKAFRFGLSRLTRKVRGFRIWED